MMFVMPKSILTLCIDTELITRAKASGINISKECNGFLSRILDVNIPNTITDKQKLITERKEKELKLMELSREISVMKVQEKQLEEKKKKEVEELQRKYI